MIQLIGIENSTFRSIRGHLLALTEDKQKDIQIKEIVEVDKIVAFNLKTIPAIAINGEVVYQQNGKKMEASDLALLITPYL